MPHVRRSRLAFVVIPVLAMLVVLTAPRASWGGPASEPAAVVVTVLDPLGGGVVGATLTLLRDGRSVATGATDATGRFTFQNVAAGRYEVSARAQGFTPRTMDPFFAGSGARVSLEIVLAIGVKQEVVVTTAPMDVPASQVGAPVTVVDREALDALGKPDVLDALRTVPGVNVVQSGARGSLTSLFIRGGASDFNKVLIDGVSANDIGGRFDFGDLSLTGVDRVEVLRDANSVIHGSDAIAGVVGITTTQGRSRTPQFTYSGDGGNFRTERNQVSFGGAANRVDYFASYSDFQTDNSLPNSGDRNRTFASRFGVDLGSHTVLTATVRWYGVRLGLPGSYAFYGLADDSVKTSHATLASVSAESQISPAWETTVRVAVTDEAYHTVNPSPTGEPYDPFGFGANYLGDTVTIAGANGYSATGRAILDFSGDYPQLYNSAVTREALFGQGTYRANAHVSLSMGGRAEHEAGFTEFFSKSTTDRLNGGGFVEARTTSRRVLSSLGVGLEHNAVFGEAVTPRASLTVYLRTPSAGAFGDTKLVANAGTGIKAPTIDQQNSSLFVVLQNAGAATASVGPIGPERARNIDIGIDQGLWRGRIRARASYFDNRFSNLIEFVSNTALPLLGISADAAAATGFGAYVNSSSYDARGLEASTELTAGPLHVTGSYTFIDAVVTASFASSALGPSFNPSFPTIPIGAFSPLAGARPFRVPAHSGNVVVTWSRGVVQATVSGTFVGRSDDSTFLSDQDFGNSLLLPNHNLDQAYQKVDAGVVWQVRPRLRWYLTVENVGNEAYQATIGFPALGRSFRTGVTVRMGGDVVKRP